MRYSSDEEVSDSDDEGELTYESRDGTKRANILSRKNGLIQFEEYEPNTQDKAQENIANTNTRELRPWDFEREFPKEISAEDLLLEAYESEGVPFTYEKSAVELFLKKARGQIYRDRESEFEFKIRDDPEFEAVVDKNKPDKVVEATVKFSKLTLVPRWNRVDQADAELLVTYSYKGEIYYKGSPCTLPEFVITGYLPTFAEFHETFERLADSEQEYLKHMEKTGEEYPLITEEDVQEGHNVQEFNKDWASLDEKFVNITEEELDNVEYGSINRTPDDDSVEEEFALVVSEDNSSSVTFQTFKESMAEEDLSEEKQLSKEAFLKAYPVIVPKKAAEFVTFAKCLENFRDAVRKRGNNVKAVGLELGVFAENIYENGKVVYDDTFPFKGEWDDFTDIINLTGTTWREEWNELYKEKDVEVYVAPTGMPEKGDIWEGFMKIFAFVVEVKDSKDRGDIKIRFRKNSRNNAWDMLTDAKNPPVESNPIFEDKVHEWRLSTFLNQYGKLYKKADEPSGSSGSSSVSPVSSTVSPSPPSETSETPKPQKEVIDLTLSDSEDEDSADKVIVEGDDLTDKKKDEDNEDDLAKFERWLEEDEEEAGLKPPSGTSSTSRLVSMLRSSLKF